MNVELMFGFGQYLFYLNFASLAVAFFFSLRVNKLNSTLLALGIMMVFEFLMTAYTPSLYQASVKYQAEYLHEFRLLWYLGYALFDLLIVALVLFAHYKFRLKPLFCAKAIILTYVIELHLQMAMYLETEFYGASDMIPIYEYGIPGFNMILASVIFGFVMSVLVSGLLVKITKFRGVSWKV